MRSYKHRSKEILFLGGWLFTDLLLLLTILFFVGNVEIKPSTPPPPPLPRLELNYKRIDLSIDPDGLLNNSPTANASVRQQIRQWDHGSLSSRRVGLAIVYAGAPDTGQFDLADRVDKKIYSQLDELGRQGFAFNHASHYDSLYLIGYERNKARIDLYLFAK